MGKLINIYKNRYSTIPNEVFNDKNLDYRSRGILCTLLSLPDGWNFSVAGLVAIVNGAEEENEKKSAVMVSIQKLERLGYLERLQIKDTRGLYSGYDYKINIPPITVDWLSGNGKNRCPIFGKPINGKPIFGKRRKRKY